MVSQHTIKGILIELSFSVLQVTSQERERFNLSHNNNDVITIVTFYGTEMV